VPPLLDAPPEPIVPPLLLAPPLDAPPEPVFPPLLLPPEPVAPPLLLVVPPDALDPPVDEPPEPPCAPLELQAANARPISGTPIMEYQESPFTNASLMRFTRPFCRTPTRIVKQFYNS